MKWKGMGGYEEKEENLLLSVVPYLHAAGKRRLLWDKRIRNVSGSHNG